MARAGGITNAVNVGIAVQADWENREFISHISLNVRRLFDFLVQFGNQFHLNNPTPTFTCLPHFYSFLLSLLISVIWVKVCFNTHTLPLCIASLLQRLQRKANWRLWIRSLIRWSVVSKCSRSKLVALLPIRLSSPLIDHSSIFISVHYIKLRICLYVCKQFLIRCGSFLQVLTLLLFCLLPWVYC